jgi:hypothetical protein
MIAALPWAWFALLAIYVAAIVAQAGHWPSYGEPDPKQAGWITVLREPGWLLLLLALFSPVLLALRAGAGALLREPMRAYLRPAILLTLGWLALIALFRLDLLGLANWWMD